MENAKPASVQSRQDMVLSDLGTQMTAQQLQDIETNSIMPRGKLCFAAVFL